MLAFENNANANIVTMKASIWNKNVWKYSDNWFTYLDELDHFKHLKVVRKLLYSGFIYINNE